MRTRRIIALVLTFLLMLAMCTAALADGEAVLNEDGEVGAFTSPDTPSTQSKTLLLKKEFVVYNVDGSKVNSPTITYDYSIAAATVTDLTVTDAADKHDPEGSVTATVKPGESNATISDIELAADKEWDSDTDGASNFETITVDFSRVVFTGAGVYRYVVTETLGSGFTYATSGITESTEPKDQSGARKRYIDVYVRPAESFNDGSTAAEWDIYGYTCFYNNTTITDANKTTVPVKTTGFVSGTTDGETAFGADCYYTFNLKLSKTVEGDAYGAANVAFPFTLIFKNDTISKNIDIIGDNDDPESGSIADASRIVEIKDGETYTYTGIPCGTDVDVYETNVATGVTYKVSTLLTDSATAADPVVDDAVTYGSAPAGAVTQTEKKAYESTMVSFSTNADQDTDIRYAVDITNTFVAISPTGVILRYAPYMLVFVGGLLLLVFGWKLLRRTRDEEETA